MTTHIARYAKVDTAAVAATGHLTLLTDQSRDPVFLKGRVRCGPGFSKVMLVLGQIVKLRSHDGKGPQRLPGMGVGRVFEGSRCRQAKRLEGPAEAPGA